MKNHSEAVNPIDVSLLDKRELSTVYMGSTVARNSLRLRWKQIEKAAV